MVTEDAVLPTAIIHHGPYAISHQPSAISHDLVLVAMTWFP
jgi:hypothetical protein